MAGKIFYQDEVTLLADKAWKTLQLEPPADLFFIAQRLGIDVYEEEFDEAIDGFYIRLLDTPPIITINTCYLKPPARRRFTLAHEIGHHLLCRKVQPGKRIFFFDDTSSKRHAMIERACDRFAALLLMPEDLIRKNYDQLSANPDNRIGIMAERFGVSQAALRRRLKDLQLIDKPRYFRPMI